MITRRYLLVFLLLSLGSLLTAQANHTGPHYCGTHGKSDWLVKYQRGLIPRAEKTDGVSYVPIRLILVGRNDGSGYVDPVKLLRSVALLNDDYQDQDIQFYIDEIDYLNRSRYFEHDNAGTGSTMMIENNERGVINNYIVGDPAGNCGYYFPGQADAIALGKDCLGALDRTWAHELGHYLSLPHTFYGWEAVQMIDEIGEPAPATVRFRGEDVPVERVDGSNCAEAADGFCDTPPDYLMERWRCEPGTNEYRDSLADPDSTLFAVNGRNIMSYALDNCLEGFSQEQMDAMFTNLTSRGFGDDSGVGIEAPEGEDLLLIAPENNATLPFSDDAVLSWTPVEGADYYIVQVNRNSNNFNGEVSVSTIVADTTLILEDLEADTRYFWRVRPFSRYEVDSDFGDQVWRFRNGEFPTSTIDPTLDAGITVAPNPIGAGQDLLLSGINLGVNGTMSIEVIDAAGRVVDSAREIRVTGNGFRTRLPTGRLTDGVYFLRLRLADKLVTRRIVVL